MPKKDKIYRKISRTDYLTEILRRLETEYIEILQLVKNYNLTHKRGIGFWSLTRMIFPVIETVAETVEKKKEDFLTNELKVPFGYLVWEIYRHALMHTDELRYALYKDKNISWAIHLDTDPYGHYIANKTDSHPTTIHIDISKLYYSLRDFLIKEIEKNDTTKINVQVGVHFPETTTILIGELEEIYSKH